MRIAIHTLGTRGDVQPYVALARGLIAAGHDVQLAAPEQFECFVAGHGVGFDPLPGGFLDLVETPEAKAAIAEGKGFGAGFKLLKTVQPLMLELFDAEWVAARRFGPELMIYHPKALVAPYIAEKLEIPAILASPIPGFTPTSAFPSPLLPRLSFGPLNRLSHDFMAGAASVLFARPLARWRQERLGLPRRGRRRRKPPTLYAYSPSVLPAPPEWGPDVLVSGYWFLDDGSDWVPPPALAAFLAAGEPPVYVGFGSMPVGDPASLMRVIVGAVDRAGCRAVVAAGAGRLTAAASMPQIHVIEGAPHDRLFPLMRAVVHHGGAGSTAAGLRAGTPTVVCPFFGDQPFWGRRIADLGVGPAPIPQRALTDERLAAAIKAAATDGTMRQRAKALGGAIRAENGIEAAVEFIERQAQNRA